MKQILVNVAKFILKVGVLLGVIVGVAILIATFTESSLSTVLFVAGGIAIFIGGIGSLGESRRRTDFDYLHMRSMSANSTIDELDRDRRDNDKMGVFQLVMMVVGIISLIIAANVR
ncbi:MAG: hypothetical protein ACRDDX_05830 [Cellulosilyticaceae bacterium]